MKCNITTLFMIEPFVSSLVSRVQLCLSAMQWHLKKVKLSCIVFACWSHITTTNVMTALKLAINYYIANGNRKNYFRVDGRQMSSETHVRIFMIV